MWRVAPVASVLGLIVFAAAPAAAQTPPVPNRAVAAPSEAPAPGAVPSGATPIPGYAYPPPPPYGYPPPAYGVYPTPLRAPESVPYNGGPVPAGYHIEERPRRGLIIGGAVTLGVPWVLGITFA